MGADHLGIAATGAGTVSPWDSLSETRPTAEWFVLHVKSRQEKVLADELGARGIACYLPLSREVRYYGNRKASVEVPLFPGYVFLRGGIEDAYRANSGKRLANILRVPNQQQLVEELGSLRLALSRAPLDPYPFLQAGIRVEVRAGPFRGLRGWIEGRTNQNRLILQVCMLAKAASLEIDAGLLDRLD